MSSQSRKQRRAYEKFLKKTNPQAYKEWKADSINRGKQIHQEHLDNMLIDNDNIKIIGGQAEVNLGDEFKDSEIIDYDKL